MAGRSEVKGEKMKIVCGGYVSVAVEVDGGRPGQKLIELPNTCDGYEFVRVGHANDILRGEAEQ